MTGTHYLLLLAVAVISAAATREFWPKVVTQTKMVSDVAPQQYGEVVTFGYDPADGLVVFGDTGVAIDSRYMVQLQTQEEGAASWVSAEPITAGRYRVAITMADPLR